jgi:hypothetical protein
MALSSPTPTTSAVTQKRAGYLHSASGLAADIKRFQAGELYVDAINEVTATGFFKYNYPIHLIPRIMTTWQVSPSGLDMYISASGEDHFVVSFINGSDAAASPVIDPLVTTPHHIGSWLTII